MSSPVLKVAAAHATHSNILVAGIAGLVAGAMSVAAGQYVSVHSQADTDRRHRATGGNRCVSAVCILFHWAGIENNMAPRASSWIRRRAEQAVKAGFLRAYRGVGVNPDKYLNHLRRVYGLHITSFREMRTAPLPVVNYLADKVIRASMKMAMIEGAGAGLGGMISILPDVGILGGITWRMIQKLSLVHGFEYASEDDMADLWLAAASAAGVDMGKDLVRKQVIERFVPRIIERIAVQAGGEIAENGLCRLVPVLGSVMGGTLNYYFVRGWGAAPIVIFMSGTSCFEVRKCPRRTWGRRVATTALWH